MGGSSLDHTLGQDRGRAGPARGGAGQHCSGGAEVKFSPQLRALQSAAAVPSHCHRSRSSCIMFLAKGILGGLVKIISNIDPADFVPSDPVSITTNTH
uniref:Uncharacterized protein n=1 Tax=Knipowitschia caucasica TaxID=637954 RepID=A0AAV2J372_KNICA